MSTLKTINIIHPSGSTNNIVSDASGNVTIGNNITIPGTGSVAGNLSFNSGYGSSAVAYGCRAWVNFNGTGTVAIRASGNVSSITDNGTGDYTANFTTSMPDDNFVTNVTAQRNTTSYSNRTTSLGEIRPGVSGTRVYTASSTAGTLEDSPYVCISVFR
jgi:hypothetical protein